MKIKFEKEQIELAKKIGVPFDITKDLTDDEICDLEEMVGDYHTLNTLGEDYKPNKEGEICLDILQILGEL